MPAIHRRPVAIRTVGLVALTLAVVLGACAGPGGVALPGTGPLVTVQMRGGMCANGACDSSVIVDRDGRAHSAAKPPNDLGQVDAKAMAALTGAIQATDFPTLKSHPFTGQCPIAFDGQELVFEFSTMTGTQRIASCEVDIDWAHPLFVAVGVALGQWVPLPLT